MDRRIALDEVDVEPELVPIVRDGLPYVGNSQHWLHPVEFETSELTSIHESTLGCRLTDRVLSCRQQH